MSSKASTIESGILSLLVHKVAPDVFDISSGMQYVSVRDQIVRARLLVNDMKKTGLAKKGMRVLVVGAGVAGISAALVAKELELIPIVVEVNREPFQLQENATHRFIGPFMYEWPAPQSGSQTLPLPSKSLLAPWRTLGPDSVLPFPKDVPISASSAAKKWRVWLRVKHPSLAIHYKVKAEEIKKYVLDFASKFRHPFEFVASEKDQRIDAPDFILLAGGFGQEQVALTKAANSILGCRFWSPDNLRDPGIEHRSIAIFGGGDGALQDTLRVLLIDEHPLQFATALQICGVVGADISDALRKLAAIEQEFRQHSAWDSSGKVIERVHKSVQLNVHELAKWPQIRQFVQTRLKQRKAPLHLVVKLEYFSKAYLLNRFVVQLIEEVMKFPPHGAFTWPQFEIHYDSYATNHIGPGPYTIELRKQGAPHSLFNIDDVVVRFGLEKPPLQMIALETPDTRVPLARIPLPTVY